MCVFGLNWTEVEFLETAGDGRAGMKNKIKFISIAITLILAAGLVHFAFQPRKTLTKKQIKHREIESLRASGILERVLKVRRPRQSTDVNHLITLRLVQGKSIRLELHGGPRLIKMPGHLKSRRGDQDAFGAAVTIQPAHV